MKNEKLMPQKEPLIAISAKINGGKDTATRIFQFMTCSDKDIASEFYDNPERTMRRYTGIAEELSPYDNVKFADNVKFLIAKLLGVTVRRLEDRDFKEAELGSEWWYYKTDDGLIPYSEAQYSDDERIKLSEFLVKLTPRKMFTLMATEGGRMLIHPNIWVNGLFADYVANSCWVISDMRFLTEHNCVKLKGGITIRLVRHKKLIDWLDDYAIDISEMGIGIDEDLILSDVEFTHYMVDTNIPRYKDVIDKLTHISETELDDVEHDYIVHNDGTIEELVNKLYDIALNEGIAVQEIKKVSVR